MLAITEAVSSYQPHEHDKATCVHIYFTFLYIKQKQEP
jgi:hypothetical protein